MSKILSSTLSSRRGVVFGAVVGAGVLAAGLYAVPKAAISADHAKHSAGITEAQVHEAQVAWGKALVQISRDFEAGGIERARATASAVLDQAYGYNFGEVLFKPTLTTAPQTFRPTQEGALAYFVGHDPAFPNDAGFAIKGWRSVEVDNMIIQLHGNTALAMGNVMVTDKDGNVTTVDKTWGYKLDDDGQLRIVLHHSSLPFNP
jgi:hypothetical protein